MCHLQTSKRKYMSAENGWVPRERLSQEPPFTYCGIDMFGSILVKVEKKWKDMGAFSRVFQVEQFILNLQIHYLLFGSILVKVEKKWKDMGAFSHVFQVEQFILNLQIHYLPMPSHKAFKNLYQEEVTFKSSELIMAQILLEQVQNSTRHFQRWTTRKSMSSCWSTVVNGSSGKGILLLLAIWESVGAPDLHVQSW